jgi:hypothetical protein
MAMRRIWTLLSAGTVVAFYTDHCLRPFRAGDKLRDDQDQRRTVLAVLDTLALSVGPAEAHAPSK